MQPPVYGILGYRLCCPMEESKQHIVLLQPRCFHQLQLFKKAFSLAVWYETFQQFLYTSWIPCHNTKVPRYLQLCHLYIAAVIEMSVVAAQVVDANSGSIIVAL